MPSASKGLPPPLCPVLPVGSLVADADGKLEGMLGASKICDESADVALAVASLSVLEAELVDSDRADVSMTRLVGTSPELAVAVLLAIEVVEYSGGDAVEEELSDVVVVSAEEPPCKTSFAFVHRFEGPWPVKNT